MNKHATYQQLREHLAYLKLSDAAEQLPGALDKAEKDKPGYTEFLSDLPDLCERLQIQRKLELSSPGRAVVMRQLTKVKEFVDALQSNYSAIVVNANYASQALV